MGTSTGARSYPRADFIALTSSTIPIALLRTKLATVPQTVPLMDVRLTPQQDGVVVEWLDFPSTVDRQAIDAEIAAFTGGTTTSEPFEQESLGVTSESAGTLIDKIDFTTPPLDAGTYQVLWNCLVGMLATVANAGVRGVITLTRSNGDGSSPVTRQWEHNWNLQQPQTFGSGITFKCQAGQKIRARLQVQKIGSPAATAQMAVARITIDQLAAATL